MLKLCYDFEPESHLKVGAELVMVSDAAIISFERNLNDCG